MSQRLNNIDREKLIKTVVKQRFVEQERQFWLQFAALAVDVRRERLGTHRIRTMGKVPADYLPKRSSFKVSFGGQQVELHLNGTPPHEWGDRKRMFLLGEIEKVSDLFPDSFMENPFAFFDAKHDLTREFERLCAYFQRHLDEVDEVKAEVRSIVYSCSTTGKLMSIWPECEPFVKALGLAATKENLPTVQIDALNKKLGLATAEAA